MSSQSPEVIERQIADKRQELAEKVGLLSDRTAGTVRQAVRSATDVVGITSDTIGTIGDTVGRIRGLATPQAVAEVVRDTVGAIPLTEAVEKSPWASVGGAAAAGFIVGLLVSRPSRSETPGAAAPSPLASAPPPASGVRSMFSDLFDRLIDRVGSEVRQVAQKAMDTAGAAVHERVNGLVESVTHNVVNNGSPFGRN
jgi:ElaB/YqjD/DUF883 family membrane-anchored ribosome-binding protein